MDKTCVIISGGPLDEAFALDVLARLESPVIIGADRGVEFLYRYKIIPNQIVGDFDSLSAEIVTYYKNRGDIPIREFNPVKDATDTEIAVRLGISLGCSHLLILGGTGGRLDHLWANVQTLAIPLKSGVKAEILDPLNRVRLIDRTTHLKKCEAYGRYFSLFPLSGTISGLSIEGARYPLRDRTITPYDSLCASNEITGEEAVIDFKEGILILIESRDR